MIVYRDIISEDEVLSDAFKLQPVIDKDGAVVRLQ
jgi:Translationally controlled tumour protein